MSKFAQNFTFEGLKNCPESPSFPFEHIHIIGEDLNFPRDFQFSSGDLQSLDVVLRVNTP